MVAKLNAARTGTTGGIRGLLRGTLQHGLLFITLRSVKKYCHDAPEGLMSRVSTNNLNLSVNCSKLIVSNFLALIKQ